MSYDKIFNEEIMAARRQCLRIEKLKQDNERLSEALAFYANEENWKQKMKSEHGLEYFFSLVHSDSGRLAKQALKESGAK